MGFVYVSCLILSVCFSLLQWCELFFLSFCYYCTGNEINPELLLAVFLPALLFESAFSMEVHQIKVPVYFFCFLL